MVTLVCSDPMPSQIRTCEVLYYFNILYYITQHHAYTQGSQKMAERHHFTFDAVCQSQKVNGLLECELVTLSCLLSCLMQSCSMLTFASVAVNLISRHGRYVNTNAKVLPLSRCGFAGQNASRLYIYLRLHCCTTSKSQVQKDVIHRGR